MSLIRQAKENDIPAVSTLGTRFFREVPTFGLIPRTEDELKKLDLKFIWVVEEHEKIAGYAICLPEKYGGQNIFHEDDKILELDEIYLLPEIRGKGTGSKLLDIIVKYAKKEGFTKFFIYSSVKDLTPIISFYRKNGLKTWAVQFYKDLK